MKQNSVNKYSSSTILKFLESKGEKMLFVVLYLC